MEIEVNIYETNGHKINGDQILVIKLTEMKFFTCTQYSVGWII